MSEFHVEVVKVGKIVKHPNADNLSIATVHSDYPCIIRTGDFLEGSLAIYVPVDALVPKDHPKFLFLQGKNRIKAKRLRGIFSMGLLIPVDPGMREGQDVQQLLGITKYDPSDNVAHAGGGSMDQGDQERDPGILPKYTDIEGLRKYGKVLTPGEEVVITEKLHGSNMRVIHDGKRLWVGSRNHFRKNPVQTPVQKAFHKFFLAFKRFSFVRSILRKYFTVSTTPSSWWQVAHKMKLQDKLKDFPMIGLYGELVGVQGGKTKRFSYGTAPGEYSFVVFDAYDAHTGSYLNYPELVKLTKTLGLPLAPTLYAGPWDPAVAKEVSEGTSLLDACHIREGVVIRPVLERTDAFLGRVILKLHGEAFLLEK